MILPSRQSTPRFSGTPPGADRISLAILRISGDQSICGDPKRLTHRAAWQYAQIGDLTATPDLEGMRGNSNLERNRVDPDL